MSQPSNFKGLGLQGLNRNTGRSQLASADAWISKNVRAFKGLLEASPGVTSFTAVALSGRVLVIRGWEKDNQDLVETIYTEQKIYKVDPFTGVVTDITRLSGNYTGSVTQLIDTAVGFDHIFSTNGIDPPQKWDGVVANASDIGGTPGVAETIAVGISYCMLGNIAGDVRGIKWSDSGAFETWVGGDAGTLTLYQGPGGVLRILPLGEVMIAYRDSSIHLLFFVGSPFIWGQRQIVTDHGLIAPRAVVAVQGRHLYWGTDNVYLFDGSSRVPVADKIIDQMNESFDPSFRKMILAFTDLPSREVYFAYPGVGDNGVNKQAWVWSWATGGWRQEEGEFTASGSWRRRTSDTWATATQTWTQRTQAWNFTQFLDKAPVTIVGTDGGKLNFIDVGSVDNLGVGRERLFETGLFAPFEGDNRQATLERIDIEQENMGGHNLEIWIGTQNTLTGDAGIVWTQYTLPANGATRTIGIRKTARYFALRLRTAGAAESFRVSGVIPYFTARGDR